MTVNESSLRYCGWRVVAASGLGVLLTTVPVFTFAALLKPLTEEFAWSREAVSRAFGAMTLAVALAAPFAGHVVDRLGPRWIVGPALTIVAGAYASLSALTHSLWHLYAVFVVIGLASAATSPVVYSRVVSGWFDRRRGVALAAVIASIGVGAIVDPLIAQTWIRQAGWRTACAALAAVMLSIGVPIVSLFVREPDAGTGRASTAASSSRVGEAVRSRAFWTLIVVVFGTTLALNGVVVHLSVLLTDRGLLPGQAAIAMSAMGGASLVGRLLTGWLLDRFLAPRVSFVLLAVAAVGTFLLATARSLPESIVAAAGIGFGTGGEVDVTPYLISRYFGLRSLSTLYGITWTAFGVAGAAGPILMGRAFDSTGSYAEVLFIFGAATLAVAALMLTLPAPRIDVVSEQQAAV